MWLYVACTYTIIIDPYSDMLSGSCRTFKASSAKTLHNVLYLCKFALPKNWFNFIILLVRYTEYKYCTSRFYPIGRNLKVLTNPGIPVYKVQPWPAYLGWNSRAVTCRFDPDRAQICTCGTIRVAKRLKLWNGAKRAVRWKPI